MDEVTRPVEIRPRSYVGQSVPRPNALRLLEGRGRFVADLDLPRLVHVAFVRSPYAHARMRSIDAAAARKAEGVVSVATGHDIAQVCKPWVGVLQHLAGMKSAPQYPLPLERACWQGEPVVAVVAKTRAQAEDAAELVVIDWEELPAVTDPETALDPATPVIHPELGDNLLFGLDIDKGGVDAAFAGAHAVVEETFHFGRHTGVPLEPRALIADYDPSDGSLTCYHASQTPYQMQDVYSRHLGIPEERVRVVAPDVGGSFGIKLHVHGEEMATAALSVLLERPVKFVADRLESFVSDIHARDHRVKARVALAQDGTILAMDVDDRTGVGPYSVYPRSSGIEGNQVVRLIGSPYRFRDYRARLRVVLQNKNVMSQYRAVGHPIAFAVTEGMVDLAAAKLGLDPVEVRRRNYIPEDAYPHTTPSGYVFERLSLQRSLDVLLERIDYPALRREQAALRARGVHRGIGLCTYVEITNPGPAFYGVGGARISAQDGCAIKLEPSGKFRLAVSVTEQGQGTETIMAQIAATELGVPMEDIRVLTGDTQNTPYGGATWACRGAGIGGEATLRAARILKGHLLAIAAASLETEAAGLDLRGGSVVDRETGAPRLSVADVARLGYFRADLLPPGFQAQLSAVAHYVRQGLPFDFSNGVHASYVEVDVDTGLVRLLKHAMVSDSGTVLNPLLVDEQARGGAVQGIGAALFEECLYGADGQLQNGTLADYLVPLATEMPDMTVDHVETPTRTSELGVKGAGECGTAGATGAVMNAVNDALRPLGASVTRLPMTPERILRALGRVSD
jgi:CO/xanthine dehydrogenase Mo-binding subunit